MIRCQFCNLPIPQYGKNSGVRHPDFDDSVITDVTEFYARFAADPDFKVRMLPRKYDIADPAQVDALIDCDEPVFGEDDLESHQPADVIQD